MSEAESEMITGEMAVPGTGEAGTIVAHFGIAVEVLFRDGERRTVRVKRNSSHVVGDDVVVCGEVLKRLPRKTELRRRDARGGIHLVAANLDVVGIVLAPMSPAGFVDRAIIAARAAELTPFVVFNKCDLAPGRALADELTGRYAPVISCFAVSAATGAGVKEIRNFLACGHRGAFVGSTGVGKSSLLNALCPGVNAKVRDVSDHKWQGRHTTTVSTLNFLPGGGELVDTPGFRDFGLVDVSSEDVVAHFAGFEALESHRCRFHDCRHRKEPGCAVAGLVAAGEITKERYQSYLALVTEIEAVEESERATRRK